MRRERSMRRSSEIFFDNMLKFFPAKKEEYLEYRQEDYCGLDTIIAEDIFMPEVIKLLEKEDNIELLIQIFSYFEEVSSGEELHLLNMFSITVLEILGNDRDILLTAQKYMGPKTKEMQIVADKELGRL